MRYDYLRDYPTVFLSTTGLLVEEFDQLYEDVLPPFVEAEEQRLARPDRQRAIGGGQSPELSARDQILLTVVWLRLYPTNEVLGYLFGVSDSSASRYRQRVLPVLEQAGRDTMRLPDPGRKRRKQLDELLTDLPELVVVLDSFEQRIQRPPQLEEQERYYSGKKKMHTLKSQVTVNEETGEIVDVSESVPGPTADIRLLEQSGILTRLPEGVGGIGDLAYTDIDKLHPLAAAPRRKPRGQPRPAEDLAYNTAFSRRRIVVEHSIGRMRAYRAITYPDRHHRQQHTPRVRAIAGLANRQLARRLAV